MAERALPGLGLVAYYLEGSDGWNVGYDANLRLLSVIVQMGVASRAAALPDPGANGYIAIVPASGGANAHRIAVRDNGAWVYILPQEGWRAFVRDTDEFVFFNGSTWQAEPDVGIADAPSDGLDYVRKSGNWEPLVFPSNTLPPIVGQNGKILSVGPIDEEGTLGYVWIEPPVGGGDPGGGGSDLPTIVDQGGKVLAVKTDASGIEWIDPPAGGGEVIEPFPKFKTWRVHVHGTDNSYLGFGSIEFLDEPGGTNLVSGGVGRSGKFDAASIAAIFDADRTTNGFAAKATDQTLWWAEYEFPEPVSVGEVVIVSGTGASGFYPGSSPRGFTLLGSNGGRYVEVERYNDLPVWTTQAEVRTFAVPRGVPAEVGAVRYARFSVRETLTANDLRLAQIEFYDGTEISIPIVSATTTAENPPNLAALAFDTSTSSSWKYTTAPHVLPAVIQIEFAGYFRPTGLRIRPENVQADKGPKSILVEVSADGVHYDVVLDSTDLSWASGVYTLFSLDREKAKPVEVIADLFERMEIVTDAQYAALPTKDPHTLYFRV